MLGGGFLARGDSLDGKNGESLILGKIPQRVMGGDEFALGPGKFREFHADPSLQFLEGLKVDGRIFLKLLRMVGIRRGKGCRDGSGRPLHVLHGVPPMGILDKVPVLFHAKGGNSLPYIDEAGLSSRRIPEFPEESLHPLAGEEDKVGIGDIADVPGRRFEFMGIDSRFDDGMDRHMAAPDVFGQIGRDG